MAGYFTQQQVKFTPTSQLRKNTLVDKSDIFQRSSMRQNFQYIALEIHTKSDKLKKRSCRSVILSIFFLVGQKGAFFEGTESDKNLYKEEKEFSLYFRLRFLSAVSHSEHTKINFKAFLYDCHQPSAFTLPLQKLSQCLLSIVSFSAITSCFFFSPLHPDPLIFLFVFISDFDFLVVRLSLIHFENKKQIQIAVCIYFLKTREIFSI